MTDLSTYPYPSYEPSKPAAGVLAAVVGVSLIAWIVQSVLAKFQPIRMSILLLLSHLTIFVELILRAALPPETRNSRAAFTTTSVLLAVGFRVIIMSNYDFLIRVLGEKEKLSRGILIGTYLCVIASAVLMIPAGALSYDSDRVSASFRLRQASAALILIMTVVFYPVWALTKTFKKMTKMAVILLIISSICCLIEALYLVISSVQEYYIATSKEELWFYIFQLTPTVLAEITWNVLHPKRSLQLVDEKQSENPQPVEEKKPDNIEMKS